MARRDSVGRRAVPRRSAAGRSCPAASTCIGRYHRSTNAIRTGTAIGHTPCSTPVVSGFRDGPATSIRNDRRSRVTPPSAHRDTKSSPRCTSQPTHRGQSVRNVNESGECHSAPATTTASQTPWPPPGSQARIHAFAMAHVQPVRFTRKFGRRNHLPPKQANTRRFATHRDDAAACRAPLNTHCPPAPALDDAQRKSHGDVRRPSGSSHASASGTTDRARSAHIRRAAALRRTACG